MLKKAAFLNACLRKISSMGTGQSKNPPDPDDQMRMKMENGFEEDDDDIEALGLPDRDRERAIRSKSNLSFHTAERFQNADGDEYFNKIYNKRSEKSLNPLHSAGSMGVKSAPPGTKKEKDPEVAAAIAELEETFKVLGDQTEGRTPVVEPKDSGHVVQHDDLPSGPSERLALDTDSPTCFSDSSTRDSDESGLDSHSESPPCTIQYDRHLVTRAGEGGHELSMDQNGFPRRINTGRPIGTSGGYSNITYSSGGSHITVPSRGLETRGLLISSYSSIRNARHSSNMSQSVLMQQRKDFQRKQATEAADQRTLETGATILRQEEWTYEPPKIDGFDIETFKKINSKVGTSSIVPIILRDDDDKGYYSRSPEIPAYTKDELDLIASLEREVY